MGGVVEVNVVPWTSVPEPARVRFSIPSKGYAKEITYEGTPTHIRYEYIGESIASAIMEAISKTKT